MKALVIGATGLIGSHVARALLAAGHEVRALRRPASRLDALGDIDGRVEWRTGHLLEKRTLVDAARGCEWVFHAAGYYPTISVDLGRVLETAVRGMRNVLEASVEAGVGLLIYTSSLTTIGPPGDGRALADERDFYVPGTVPDAYFEAKWAMEGEAFRYADRELRIVVVNPTICIGPGDPKPTSGRLVRDIARGALPAIVDGLVNVIDVRDVAVGHVRAAERGTSNAGAPAGLRTAGWSRRYILGNENTTMSALCERVARLAGKPAPRVAIPGALAHAAAVSSEYLAKYVTGRPPLLPTEGVNMIRFGRHYDVSRARSELDLPQTPVDVAIQDALAWFRARGAI